MQIVSVSRLLHFANWRLRLSNGNSMVAGCSWKIMLAAASAVQVKQLRILAGDPDIQDAESVRVWGHWERGQGSIYALIRTHANETAVPVSATSRGTSLTYPASPIYSLTGSKHYYFMVMFQLPDTKTNTGQLEYHWYLWISVQYDCFSNKLPVT